MAVTGATAAMPPAVASLQAATAVMPPPAPTGQLSRVATSLSTVFQTQELARDDMDVDPSKRERMSTATAMMAHALASVAQA